MTRFFTHERFGRPQFLAGLLLMAFLAQALWLVHSELNAPALTGPDAPSASELARIVFGWRQFHDGGIAGAPFSDPPNALPAEVTHDANGFDPQHSPLLSLLTAAPLLVVPQRLVIPEYSPVLALAPAPSFPGLRTRPRRLPVVCSPPPLRQHRRIPRPDPLLFLSFDDPVQRPLAHRA